MSKQLNKEDVLNDIEDIIRALDERHFANERDALKNIAKWIGECPSKESVAGYQLALEQAATRAEHMAKVIARGSELLNTVPHAQWWIHEAHQFLPTDDGTPT